MADERRTLPKIIDVQLNQKKVLYFLIAIIGILLLLNFGMQFRKYVLDPNSHIFLKLQVNSEGNVATFFSVLLLLTSAVVLAFIAFVIKRLDENYAKHWTGLSIIFFYLAMDEAAGIHEKFTKLTQGVFHESKGVFFLAWVIPFGLLLLVFLIAYLRFLIYLPLRSRILFMVSGGIYVFGALVMEIVGGLYLQRVGDNLTFQLILSLEEGMEMFGISLFIFSLLDYIQKYLPKLELELL